MNRHRHVWTGCALAATLAALAAGQTPGPARSCGPCGRHGRSGPGAAAGARRQDSIPSSIHPLLCGFLVRTILAARGYRPDSSASGSARDQTTDVQSIRECARISVCCWCRFHGQHRSAFRTSPLTFLFPSSSGRPHPFQDRRLRGCRRGRRRCYSTPAGLIPIPCTDRDARRHADDAPLPSPACHPVFPPRPRRAGNPCRMAPEWRRMRVFT